MDVSAANIQKETQCAKYLGSLHNCAWHHSCAFWSGMRGVLAESPHLCLDQSVTGNQKFGILKLAHKHNIFINHTLLQPSPKPWILAQLESFFHKCVLAFWTC